MATQTSPKGLKHPMPFSSLTGWASAWRVLDKIDNDAQRDALGELVRTLGVQGATNLKYAADHVRRMTGLALYKAPAASVRSETVAYVERRVRDELMSEPERYGKLFPLMRSL